MWRSGYGLRKRGEDTMAPDVAAGLLQHGYEKYVRPMS